MNKDIIMLINKLINSYQELHKNAENTILYTSGAIEALKKITDEILKTQNTIHSVNENNLEEKL